MIEQYGSNRGLFITATVISSLVDTIGAAIFLTNLIRSAYDGVMPTAICIAVFLLWQFAHVGLCCYYYFTDTKPPTLARIYLYADLGLIGLIMIWVLMLLVFSAISVIKECEDRGSAASCVFAGLLWAVLMLVALCGYCACNILLAYCVFHLKEIAKPEYVAVAQRVIKKINT